MDYILFVALVVSFILAMITLPAWIKKCKNVGLVWEDMNKWDRPKNVASSGGVIVIMSFILGLFSYIAIKTFLYGGTTHALEIFSLISVVLILGVVGLVDDLLGWKHRGLPKRIRIALAIVASIPLVVINAGEHIINMPFLGNVDFGILYPLILIPLGIVGATTTYNFLAGFNGLEAGQGIIILTFLSFVAYVNGSGWLAIVGLCMVASLIAFFFYNKFPAKIFPGGIMTYSIGALIAGMAILGNFEKIAIIVFVPYIIETILKSRGRLVKQSFGIPDRKGYLKMPYNKIYGLEHFAIWFLNKYDGGATERRVTYVIYSIQIIFILIALLVMFL